MLSADDLFRRNFQYARSINYDLSKVHSNDVCEMIRTSADSLLLDDQMLSLTLRATAAFHLDTAKVRIDNDQHREKHIVDYTLIITTIGSGKSTIFNKLSQATTKREEFENRRKLINLQDDLGSHTVGDEKKPKKKASEAQKGEWCRHVVINDFTGAGIFKSLNDSGNVLILIDEFDGEHQKSNIFSTDNKSGSSSLTSANGLLKTMHTGVDFYRKTRADGHVTLSKPHTTFLGASNGNVVVEIIRQKLRTSNCPDAMVERFQWEALMACTKLNATRLVNIPSHSIGLELYFLASSLLSNHTFVFHTEANLKMCSWMDELALARARWDQIDCWLSGRLAKSIDQTARIAAQLSHIELTMKLLKEFVNLHNLNTFGSISFEIYCELVNFIQNKYPPVNNTIIEITAETVDSAIYSMDVSMVKYMNLFNTDPTTTSALLELPMHPPPQLDKGSNPSMSNLPTTQPLMTSGVFRAPKNEFQELQKLIMLFPSITFTRTMLYVLSKVKAKQNLLNNLLTSLLDINLLKQFEKGVVTGSRRSTLYIKALPTTETLNTANQFTLDLLDQINLPWLMYRPTCTTLLLPSSTSVLSHEVNQYLQAGIYQQVIIQQGVAKKNSKSATSSSHSPDINDTPSIIQSTDSHAIPSANASPNITLSPTQIINANMPQPPSNSSRALVSLVLSSHTNEHLDRINEYEDENTKNQKQMMSRSKKTVNVVELNDENQYSANLLVSKRQSSRIEQSKRSIRSVSIDSSSQKKKKK